MTFLNASWERRRRNRSRTLSDEAAARTRDYPWTDIGRWESLSGEHRLSGIAQVSAGWTQAHSGGVAVNSEARTAIFSDARILDRKGLIARTPGTSMEDSDRELLLQAYLQDGRSMVSNLDVEGAFVIVDGRAARLFAWRDALGTRPLYVARTTEGDVLVGSSLESITSHPRVAETLDLLTLKRMIQYNAFEPPSGRTLREAVRKVPPGCTATVQEGRIDVDRYWSPDSFRPSTKKLDASLIDEAEEVLSRAIRTRAAMIPGVVAAHVSGGLDSSTVAAHLVDAVGEERFRGHSWSPPRDVLPPVEQDERDLVDRLATHLSVPIEFCEPRAEDVLAAIVWDASSRPTHTIQFEQEVARKVQDHGSNVVFSGWGGDETLAFNGRGYFAGEAGRGRFRKVHREIELRCRLYDTTRASMWRSRVALPYLPSGVRRALGRSEDVAVQRPSFISGDLAEALLTVPFVRPPLTRELPGVHRNQRRLMRNGHLAYRAESWAELGAPRGVSYEFPLLDRRVVEFALQLPADAYFHNGWKRWLFRSIAARCLPDEIAWLRNKADPALGAWLQWRMGRSLRDLHGMLLARGAAEAPLVDARAIAALVSDAHQSRDDASRFWLAFVSAKLPT